MCVCFAQLLSCPEPAELRFVRVQFKSIRNIQLSISRMQSVTLCTMEFAALALSNRYSCPMSIVRVAMDVDSMFRRYGWNTDRIQEEKQRP